MRLQSILSGFFNSRNIIFVILFVFIYVLFNQSRWEKESKVIEWDVISYYAYLPATFIYKDITLEFVDNYQGEHKFTIWYDTTKEGERYIRTSLGLSFLYSPFFFMGHAAAHLLDYDTGGYSAPYKFFLQFSCLFYLAFGLFFLRKVLRRYFEDWIVAITLVILAFFTNLAYYSVIENTMVHAYNFSLVSIIIYLILKWFEKPNKLKALFIGLLFGLLILIRPTNIVVVLFFLFYGVESFKDFGNRWKFFLNQYVAILIMVFAAIIPWIPQMIYWKVTVGHWLYYSYGNSGGNFYFDNPQIINGLLSYRKGWFLYTPAMIFSIIGIGFLYSSRLRKFFFPVLITWLVFIYITFSWWCWWYGGGLSSRPMVDIYGILAIPLAAFINKLTSIKKPLLKYGIMILFVLLILKSGFVNFQYKYQAIHYDSNTKETYWEGFFKHKTFKGYWASLCKPDYSLARQGIYVCEPVVEQ